MCKNCILNHISRILESVHMQSTLPGPCQLQIIINPVKQCDLISRKTPFVAPSSREFTFPGTSHIKATAFVRMVRILDLLLTNLEGDKVVTSRNLYYQDVALFKDQRNVVRCIERLATLLKVSRKDLGVMPSPNGLLAGNLTLALDNGEIIEVKRTNGPTLIPVQGIMHVCANDSPRFVSVVEKEAVFSYLHNELTEAIVITGRGFPDHATRNLVKALSMTYPEMPMYGSVDSDPHGILICRNYECGSRIEYGRQEAPINITYLGVSLIEQDCGLVPMSINDITLSISTLKKPWIDLPGNRAYKIELQRGLFMSLKGEIDQLDHDQSRRMSKYVREKVRNVEITPEEQLFVRQDESDDTLKSAKKCLYTFSDQKEFAPSFSSISRKNQRDIHQNIKASKQPENVHDSN